MALKYCEHCGAQIPTGSHKLRKYCSDSCRTMASQARHKDRPPLAVVRDDATQWPSEFAATLSRLTVDQRRKLRAALEADDRLRAQARVPDDVDLAVIDCSAYEARQRLGPTADLRRYGWRPGAALTDFIQRAQ